MATKKAKRSYTRKAKTPSAFTTMKQIETRTVDVEIEFPVFMPFENDKQGIRFSLNTNLLECKLDVNNENEEWDDFDAEVWFSNEWDTPVEFATFLTRLGKLVDDTLYLAGKR